ncbi:MAG: hypothetical protein HUU38_17720 [Anaerolineales bacterium]|nr:hypothetical protein [Anaerolineales bacterium]
MQPKNNPQNGRVDHDPARKILAEVREAYDAWHKAHPVRDYPPASTLFVLPVEEILRWLRFITANLKAHGIHPDMQQLLQGTITKLEALGYRSSPDA